MLMRNGWRRAWVFVLVAAWLCPRADAGDREELAVALVPEELRQLVQDRDWPAALQAIDKELQQPDAQSDRLYFLRGCILTYQQQYDAAVVAWQEVEQRFPASPWARRARFAAAMALAKQGNFQAAGPIYRNEAAALLAPERAAQTAGLYLSYADACFDPEDDEAPPDYAAALALYEKALEAGPHPDRRLDVELRGARCKQLMGQASAAALQYAAFVLAHPEAPQAVEATYRLGECRLESGALLQARLVWQELLTTYGADPSPWVAEASFRLSCTWGLPAHGLTAPGITGPGTDEQLLLGVDALRDFLKRFPAHERVGEAYLIMAEGYIAREKFADAARTLEEFLTDERRATSDQMPRVRQRLGYAYLRQGRLADAARVWQEFLTKHPSDAAWSEVQRQVIDTEYLMAANERDAGQFDTARRLLREFLAKYPLDNRAPEILWLLGQMSFQQQAWEDSIHEWRQLVSKYPTTEEASRARYQIAAVLEQKLARPREALQEYKKILASEVSGRAREAETRMTAPSMTVTTPRVFRSDETPHLDLTTRNVRSVTFRVYRLNMESYFRKVCLVGDVERLDIGLIDPDVSVTFEVPAYEDYREIVSHPEIPLPGGVTQGAVAVTASYDTLEATTLVLQSDLEIVVQAGRNDVLVFAENMQTGQPWPGAKLLLSDGQRVFAEATTGADGVFHAAYAELANSPDIRVAVLSDGHVASNVIGLEGIQAPPPLPDKGYLYSECPVYHAGEIVRARGCIRRAVDDRWVIEAGRAHELEVFDPRNRMIWHEPVVLGSFGTFDVQFSLPTTSCAGTYRIQARDDAGNAYQGTFQVAEQPADTAIVSIDLPKNVYYRGEDITGTIRVAYRYGMPAVGQLVHYQLMNDREFTARTNERGEVPFALSTRNIYADQKVVLAVKLPDLEIERAQEISFAVNGFGVEVSTPRDVFLANEPFDVTLAARDAEGKPVSQPLNLEVRRLTKVGDTEVEQAVQGHAVNTGEPDGVARKTLQLAATGRYRLRVSGEDRRGNQIGEHHDVQISGEDDPTRLRILLEDRVWRVGDRAEVVLHWREKPALALVTIQADQVWDYRLVPLQTGPNLLPVDLDKRLAPRFQLKAVVMLDSRTAPGTTTADATPDATSSLRLHTAEVALDVADALRVTLSYPGQGQERNVVKPGQPVEITVRTTDSQGRPVPAEVSLALLEVAARNQLSETPLAGMSEFFRPETRPLSVRSGSSIEFTYPPATLPVNQPQSAEGARGIDPRMGTVSGVSPIDTPPPATQDVPAMWPGMAKPASGTGEAAGTSAIAPGNSDIKVAPRGHRESQAVPRSTAYWSAAVATDDTGVATVTVNVPRHLATWQLVAKGITRESVAGETVETVVSEQALFGELKVPATLVPGDETEVVAVVHNLRNEPAAVEARLAMSFAGQTVEQTQNATVDARGRQELRFPLAGPVSESAVAPGASPVVGTQLASIRLTLMQGEVMDTVEHVIPLPSRAIATYSTIRGMADSNRSVTVAPPAGSVRDSLRLRVLLRTSMEESLWDAVMTPGIGVGHESKMATMDSLSSDVLSAVGIQQLLQWSATAEDLRARQLAARIRASIAELVSAQRDDGAWGWSLGSKVTDRYATARVVWALSVARQAGHHVPDDCLRKATEYLTGQLADTAPDDRESKAILLHGLSAAGQSDFSLGNRLYRERAQLSTPALLYLALAFTEMDRGPTAAELLGICEQRANDMSSGTVPAPPAPLAAQAASAEWLVLRALALTRVAPEADSTGAVIEQVLVQRQGLRWTPDRATGPAVLALCRWFDHHRQASPNRTFKVSVNDRPAQVCELPVGPGEFEIDVPADQLADGDQRVAIEPAGPGRYLFDVVLSGVSIAEPFQSTTQAWRVTRTYSPAPREQSGRPLRRGFAIVRDTSKAFVNPLTQLPVGQRGEVELQVTRDVPDDTPAEMLDYLVVTELIPSGVTVLTESILGPHEHVEWSPGQLTFYLGKSRTFTPIRYEVVGQFAGESQAGATVAWNAYRPEERVVAEPKRLRVLPPGAVSADPYRWTPQELYELGKLAYQQRDWPRAELLLTQLLDEWSLKPGPYRDTVEMLLDVAIELQKSDRVVRYFEIVFEQWPDKVFVLDKVVRIGAAYQELGEAERSYQVFRAAVEGAFTREAGVAGVLLGMGKRLPSARVVQRLLCEYPPEPYVASAHLALAQQIATWASDDTQEAQRPEVGVQSSDLLTAAWRMQEDYLVEYPLAPNADQAAFAAANALLELKDFARAAAAAQRYAVRYPDSELLDDFWFMAGYCRFLLGEFEPAIEMLHNVTSGKFLDKSSGQLGESDNKSSAVYVLGQIYHSLGRVVEAMQEYQRVEDRFPDAKASVAAFLREGMRLPELTTVRPGKPVAIELTYRNVATCDLKGYRIDLEKFAVLLRSLAGIRDINLAGIEPYRETTVALGDGKDYRDLKRVLPLELSDEGAYLIVCRGGSQFASGLVLVTSLELEVCHDPQANAVRVTLKDTTNDQYVYGADVTVIGAGRSEIASGQTDRRGSFAAEGILGSPTVIARAGAGKCALHRSVGSQSPVFGGDSISRLRSSGAGVQAATGMVIPDAPNALDAAGTILAGPGFSPGDQRIAAILETRTALKFEEAPLVEVAQFIMQKYNFTVLIDRRALDDVGLGSDTPVTFDAGDLSLGAALTLILKELDLTYVVQHEALHITTPEEGENELTTMAYPVTDLIRFRDPDGKTWSDFDTLIGTIRSTVSPDAWDEVGGSGAIEAMPIQDKDVLVISQTQQVHRDIASVLQRLRTMANQDRAAGELPVRPRPEGFGGDMPPGAGGFGGGAGMGVMGGGAIQAGTGGAPMSSPGWKPGRGAKAPDGSELLQGLEATKRRLQGNQVDELQRLYDQGKGGMGGMGGVGAGGFF